MISRVPQQARPTLALVGATGAVGSVMLRVLSHRADIWGEIRLVASRQSAGRTLTVRGEDLVVQELSEEVFDGVDIALFDVPADVAAQWAPVAAERGAVVVDNSSAFRGDPQVPLVAPEVNPAQVRNRPRGIIANPACVTLAMIDALGALHSGWELTELVVSTYQAASGAGQAGIDRLHDELEAVAGQRGLGQQASDVRAALGDRLDDSSPFVAPLALNVVPWVGHPAPDGWTSEELCVRHEARRILGLPELKVSATCVRVPVVTGHSISVHATFARPIKVEEARQALVEAPSVVVLDDPEAREFPTPADIVGSDPTFVGRMRQAVDFPHTIEMFICGDNLRKGAALNTVQVAELVARDLARDLAAADVDLAGWSDEVEQISQQYAERYGVERTSPWFLLKLQEEVGELTQAYLQVTGQGRDKGRSAEELEADLQAEVADVLAMLLLFARHHGVDVDEALERKWVAYRAANLSR